MGSEPNLGAAAKYKQDRDHAQASSSSRRGLVPSTDSLALKLRATDASQRHQPLAKPDAFLQTAQQPPPPGVSECRAKLAAFRDAVVAEDAVFGSPPLAVSMTRPARLGKSLPRLAHDRSGSRELSCQEMQSANARC